jgi:hypothetical protein
MLLGALAALIFLGVYLMFAGQVSATELLAGIPAAVAAAAYAVLLHRVAERPFRLDAPWPRVLGKPLMALFPDVIRVGRTLLRVLWRRPPGMVGTIVRQPFQAGGADPASAARRGLVTLAASLAPNGYGMDILDGADVLVLHRLAPAPLAPDQRWPL